jgi:uncharacterized protein YndB with AHSA1/START domain
MTSSSDTADRELVVSRTINAPRELVFAAWTDPQHIDAWWGPNGFTTTTASRDVRVGGSWVYMMVGPDGTEYPNVITYTEIRKPERICYDHGDDKDPCVFTVTVTFEPLGDKTALTLRTLCASVEQVREFKKFGAVEGGQQTLARLDQFLSTGPST